MANCRPINGEQFHGDTTASRMDLAARALTERWGVVECSNDGKRYRTV